MTGRSCARKLGAKEGWMATVGTGNVLQVSDVSDRALRRACADA